MTPDECEMLQAAMRAENGPYEHRMFSFGYINDAPDNRSVELVVRAGEQELRGKANDEKNALAKYIGDVLGRDALPEEIVIRAIQAPSRGHDEALRKINRGRNI